MKELHHKLVTKWKIEHWEKKKDQKFRFTYFIISNSNLISEHYDKEEEEERIKENKTVKMKKEWKSRVEKTKKGKTKGLKQGMIEMMEEFVIIIP